MQIAGESICMGNQSARLSLKQLETTQDLKTAKAIQVCGQKSNWETEKLQWEWGRRRQLPPVYYRGERPGYEREADRVREFKVSVFNLIEK